MKKILDIDHALGLRSEKARKRIFMGPAGVVVVGEVGEVGDCTLSVELLEMLPEDAERRRDSSMVACRLTLAWEYGVGVVSRISTNLEPDMIEIGIAFWRRLRLRYWWCWWSRRV